MNTKLFVIEGIDCSGKTYLARYIADMIGYRYDHEPTFSSEEADDLNFKKLDPYQREFYFMKDRLEHQSILNRHNTVLDRYVVSGMAYSKVFAPKAYEMTRSIYMLKEFKVPDVIIWVKMPIDNALIINKNKKEECNKKLTALNLIDLNSAMGDEIKYYCHEKKILSFIVDQEFGYPEKAQKEILNIVNQFI